VLCAFLLQHNTYTAFQNSCLTFFLNHHFPCSRIRATPNSGVLISPPGSGTLSYLLLVSSLLKNNPLPHISLLAPRRSPEPNSKLLLTRNQVCVMTLVERHSHRPHYPTMPYKYTPVSARPGPSPPSYPHTPLTSVLPLPFLLPSSTPPAPTFPLE
jgi:hypothetical protein